MLSTTSDEVARPGDVDDYGPMLDAVTGRFAGHVGPLFTTDVDGLWETWLRGLPAELRRHHTCNACRRFVEKYGGLVSISADGYTKSVMFGDAPGVYGPAFRAAGDAVEGAKVTGVFVSSDATWGLPRNKATNTPAGFWRHMSVSPSKARLFRGPLKTAHQESAEKTEDYRTLCRGLADFTADHIRHASAIVDAEALYRVEKVAGPLRWLSALHLARAFKYGRARDNVTWLAVATAPAGFCHIRSTMVGTLLEDVAAGLAFDDVKRKFDEKMNPLKYRRPVAPPSAGNVAAAEKAVATLNATGALNRRFARLEDISKLWVPKPRQVNTGPGSIFGHLLAPSRPSSPIKAPPMTWAKFARVLDGAAQIECLVPSHGGFLAFVTAADPAAPPVIQWDREDCRNPVNWYVYPSGSPAAQWSLRGGTWAKVTAVANLPFMWPGTRSVGNQGEGVVFLLEGCRDTREAGNALFPEVLRSEWHPYRATVEAYARRATISGRDEQSASGLELRKGARSPQSMTLRVTDVAGTVTEYTVDRYE